MFSGFAKKKYRLLKPLIQNKYEAEVETLQMSLGIIIYNITSTIRRT